MTRKTTLSILLSVAFAVSLNAQNDEFLFSPKGVAEIRITLSNGKTINDIKNEKNDQDYAGKLEGTLIIKNSALSTYDSSVFYNGKILIDGRGNTTWGVPKKPYNIDLINNAGEENPAALLDMPESEEWCLLAFWHDRSLMRIPIATYLGQHLNGIKWTPRLRYVELWVNNEYRGLYCLSEKVQRGDNRVDLKKLTDAAEDQTEPRVTGGYLLEASSDEKFNDLEKQVQFQTARTGINFTFKYPKPKNVTQAQRQWIKNHLDEFENVLWGSNFADPANGYLKYLDVESFIDWTILHEQSKGPDNLFHASTFVSKERNKKINMNAPWDFDLSYANTGNRNEAGNMVRTHRWFARLADDPVYFTQYTARFDELRPLFRQIPQILEANYQFLLDNGALAREKAKWPQILTEYSPSSEANMVKPTDYHAHVRYLSDWIQSRDAWCYIELGKTEQGKADRLRQTQPVIRILDFESMEKGNSFYVKVMQNEDNTFNYYWNDSQTSSSSSLYRISRKGKYWVKIVDNKGNPSLTSDTLYFGVPAPPTAIEKINVEPVISCINPVQGVLHLNYYASQKSGLQLQIIDLSGRKLIENSTSLSVGNNPVETPVYGLHPGIYILRLLTENGSVSRKIIVK
ncbi:hypothetical protein FACS189451_05800 [Bacteroidia bacterium]|nr:hypothetical protein FACS189446_6490 [Bacteroidia bacterium]GHT62149.1 hypothetical protein FACS189451_05800 [Bacteroidia bacterium]